MENPQKTITSHSALQNCTAIFPIANSALWDISFVRLVVGATPEWEKESEGTLYPVEIHLDRKQFSGQVILVGKGEKWVRFEFEKMLPSARACLRAFLSPKKIGESIVKDWSEEGLFHYHGLNESELWFAPRQTALFTYLDLVDFKNQFIVRWNGETNILEVGSILRQDYFQLSHLQAELPLIALADREVYARLSECRDIVTNFRSAGQIEFHLKQKLLKVISENLYSTSRKVEMAPSRRPVVRPPETQTSI